MESAELFERRLVSEAEAGALVLTSGGRLARRILHRHRTARASGGPCGWSGLKVQSLNAWTMNSHAALWPETRPMGRAASLRLWHEAASSVLPPEGLAQGPALYGDLQRVLDDLLDHRSSPASGAPGHDLSDWRRTVTRRFQKLAEREGFHPGTRPLLGVRGALLKGSMPLPERVVLAGFQAPSPLEELLFEALAERSSVVRHACAATKGKAPTVRAFGTMMQECRAVCSDILEAWNVGRTDLGVVYLDPSYFDLLKRCFDELAGEGPRPDRVREIRYNLAGGTPLEKHPLFLTGLLPLRAAIDSYPAPLLASLLCSPYAGGGARRAGDVRGALFAASAPLGLASCLDALGRRNLPVVALRGLASLGTAALSRWVEALRACWKGLGFVTFEESSRDADAIARRHLEEVANAAASEAGALEVTAEGALAWITACAAGLQVAEPTPETAGIQVLDLHEALGLSFEELWVVGVHGGSLPQPALDRPLLHPAERRLLPGGTPELRWEEAHQALGALRAGAPVVHLSRPWATDDEALLPPCPLAADECTAEGETLVRTVDLWAVPPAPWMRARWLRDGLLASLEATPLGLGSPDAPGAREEDRADFRLSGEWRVTQFGELTACPFRFYAGSVLALAPLRRASEGIDPMERGSALHRVLAAFVDGLRRHVPSWPRGGCGRDQGVREEALSWLTQVVDAELSNRPRNVFWEVERLRWMGDDETGAPGLLTAWLDLELARAEAGWEFDAAEAEFQGLTLGPVTLRGRVDRVDRHPDHGVAVWDYKSGRAPSAAQVVERFEEPQLPAYLLALTRGLVQGVEPALAGIRAGYIALRKPGEAAVEPLQVRRQEVDWAEFLPRWIEAAQARMADGVQGLFAADPRPASRGAFTKRNGACQYCEVYDLCGRFDGAPADGTEEEDAEEETL